MQELIVLLLRLNFLKILLMTNFLQKKSLGQHFLNDLEVLKNIVSLVEIHNENIIEIGPGKGALTKFILHQNPKKITLIEKDERLKSYLEKIFQLLDFFNLRSRINDSFIFRF